MIAKVRLIRLPPVPVVPPVLSWWTWERVFAVVVLSAFAVAMALTLL